MLINLVVKGIPPVMKTLNSSNSWVPALCKKLTMWRPWVAQGDIPFHWSKGEETSKYKELNPTTRLLMLKALCEIRLDQDDTASYLSDALKSGTQLPCFLKDKIGGDGNGTTYWSDGSEFTGKNEEVLKRKQRKEESLLNSNRSCATGVTRSCRLHRPVSYTFDAYDRAINEAIHATKNGTVKEQKNKRLNKIEKDMIEQVYSTIPDKEEASVEKQVSMDDRDDQSDGDYLEREEDADQNDDAEESESSDSEKENRNEGYMNPRHQQEKPHEVDKCKGLQCSSRIVENNKHDEHKMDIISKNRSRVRPTRNSAIESNVVPEDEASEKELMDELSKDESISSDSNLEDMNHTSS